MKLLTSNLYKNNFKTETLIYHHSLFLSTLNKTNSLPPSVDHVFSTSYRYSAILSPITLYYFVNVRTHDILQLKTH